MRTIVVVVCCSLLSVTFGFLTHAEPIAREMISFSLPFGAALADELKPGLKIVLIGEKICEAKTGGTFTHDTGNHKFQATNLLDHEKCDLKNVNVAVMGVKAEAMGVISPTDAPSAVPKDIELKVRRLLLERDAAGPKIYSYAPLSDNSPKTFRVKEGMLLLFNWKKEDNGPSVWVVDDKVFLLPGVCRSAHRSSNLSAIENFSFFTVEDRLFLAYRAGGCCRCGDNTFYVYDLSGSEPKSLYQNGELAD